MEKIKELNMTELEQVNGGWSVCVGIGVSGGPVAQACWGEGKITEDNNAGIGVTACAYVGFGIGASEKKSEYNYDDVPYWMDNA